MHSSLWTLVAFTMAVTDAIHLPLHRSSGEQVHYESYADRRRMLQKQQISTDQDTTGMVPLHPGLGTHYTWVYAGTPPQRASVIADTGSSLMAFPCSECIGCGSHTDRPFNAANSSTLTHVSCGAAPSQFRCENCGNTSEMCTVSQRYVEGSSWSAAIVEDVVYLGGEDSFEDAAMRKQFGTRFPFGCQQHENGLFVTQVAGGIMGLSNSNHHIISRLYEANKIQQKSFALCFAAKGGSMTIGAPETSRHVGDIQYAKLQDTDTSSYYNVKILDILIGNMSIEAPSTSLSKGHFVVDSGTTDSYLPTSLQTEFRSTFMKVAGQKYQSLGHDCQGYSEKEAMQLPDIQFVLEADDGGNVTLSFSPLHYIAYDHNHFCGSIILSEASGGVLGANLMLDHDVLFEPINSRVGFVKANCTFAPAASDRSTNGSYGAGTESSSWSVEEETNQELVPASTKPVTPPEMMPGLNRTSVLSHMREEDHPMVLTIVGIVLVVAFVLIVVISISQKRRKRKGFNRVARLESDDIDEEEEFGLVEPTSSGNQSNKRSEQLGDTELELTEEGDEEEDALRPSSV